MDCEKTSANSYLGKCMAHLLNLNNKKTEFPNNLNEDVDSKQSHQDKDTSGSTTLDSKKMSSSEKSAQKKVPIIIPKLKIHSPLAVKIPISPRAFEDALLSSTDDSFFFIISDAVEIELSFFLLSTSKSCSF